MELKIDPEFESQIPPLADDEYQLLEENIVADGIIINPLIIWNGVIVDGHNRFHIAEKHPHIQYTIYEKEFSDRHVAIAWICRNQLGRRNLTAEQKKYLIGKQYESEKASYGGERGTMHDENGQFTASSQFGNLRSKEKTCERIAKENGIGKNTVLRAENFSKAVDIVDEVVPGTRKEILSGDLKPTDKEIRAMARAGPEECAEMVEELRKPKDKRNLLKKISEDMLHARSSGKPSSMIYEMNDALESLIFRWEFCYSHYRQFFDDESCRGEVKQLIQKGFEFKRITKAESEWTVIEDSHEAIISQIDFDSVQKVLKLDTRRSPDEEAVQLFSGMVFCGDCGASMVRKTVPAGEKKYVYYICSAHKQDKSCSPHRIRDIALEEIVLDSLKQHIREVVDMSELLDITDTAPLRTAQAQKIQRQIDKKYEEYERLQKLLMSLYENLTDGVIDRDEYTRLKTSFTARADEAEKQMDALRENLTEIQNHGTENAWMDEFKKRQGLTSLDRAVVVALIDRILIHSNDTIEIIYRWQDEFAWQLDILRSTKLQEVG